MNKASLLLSNLKLIAKDKVKAILTYQHTRLLADPPRHDDLYVVSFPKSGSTWLAFLMANIHLKMSGDSRNVTFFNVHNFIPDIHFSRHVRQEALPFPGVRVMKSHSIFNPCYKNAVYLVRDPRDVMVSYYHFLLGLDSFNGDIKSLIRSESFGIAAWCEHVRGWMEDTSAATRFIFIRYEDLKSEPFHTLKKIYGFIGYELEEYVLESAVKKSSFENMKALEGEYAYGGRDVAEKLRFIRKGKTSGGKEELDSEDIAYIKQVAGKWMNKFGYTYE